MTARDTRIEILRRSEAGRSAFNEPDGETWPVYLTTLAARVDLSDGEREAAGQQVAALMARFRIPASPTSRGITPRDRLRTGGDGGDVWNIRGIKAVRGTRGLLEITAEGRTAGGA